MPRPTDQQAAFSAFFDNRARYPRFKSRSGRQAATYTRVAFHIKDGALRLAKTDAPLRFVWTWPDADLASLDPTSVTVTRDPAGRWFVTFHVDKPDPGPLPAAGQNIDVDMGLKDFAVLSTGEKVPHPRDWERHERSPASHPTPSRCRTRPPGTGRAPGAAPGTTGT